LKSCGRIVSGLTYLYSTHGIRLICRPADVMAFYQGVIAWILSQNSNCHIAPTTNRHVD